MDPRLGTAIIVVVGVPAVLVGYIYATELCPATGAGRRAAAAPAVALARSRRSLFLGVFLDLPDDRDDHPGVPGQARHELRRPRQLRLVLRHAERLVALRNNVLWVVLLTLFDGRRRACSSRSSSTASATRPSAKSVIFVPLAISMVAAGVIWQFMYEYQPPGEPPDRHAERRRSASFGLGPDRLVLQTDTLALNTIRADRRHGVDVDGLRDGHHLGRAEGHQRRAARGGPGRRRDRVAGLPADRLPAAAADDRRRLDDDHHHGPQGLRHRLRR